MPSPVLSAGDTAFLLVSAFLVMLMTPGLALFYGGMVRQKNVLGTYMQSFICLALVSVLWILLGYTLAFGPDRGGLVGSLAWLGFQGVGEAPNPGYAATVPHAAFALFQMMFAIITPALISGAIAERVRFPAYLLFVLLWATFVYDPLAHWVWGVGGWLRNMGALDFAGGIVVHISAGFSGLVAALYLGRRRGFREEPMPPHNVPMTVLGAGLLWFGWFGFNAGSALAASGLAVTAALNTNTAAATAALGWVFVEWLQHGKPTALGAVSGAVAGLATVTPAAGYVTPLAALLIGLLGGVLCCLSVSFLKPRLGYDDSLDAFGCHGLGGVLGVLATGIFASAAINPAGADGLLLGNPALLGKQAIAVLVTIVFTGGMTFLLLKLVDVLVGVRVGAQEEETGLDLSQHGERAYPDSGMAAWEGTPAEESLPLAGVQSSQAMSHGA